jgi:hypothetical protein
MRISGLQFGGPSVNSKSDGWKLQMFVRSLAISASNARLACDLPSLATFIELLGNHAAAFEFS